MAAKDNLNNEQLAMFMPAKELIKIPISPAEVKPEMKYHAENGTNMSIKQITRSMWDQKLSESQDDPEPGGALGDDPIDHVSDTLYDSIQERGVINPVTLGFTDGVRNKLWGKSSKVIIGGHHRIAAANDINPDMEVPVRYTSDWYY